MQNSYGNNDIYQYYFCLRCHNVFINNNLVKHQSNMFSGSDDNETIYYCPKNCKSFDGTVYPAKLVKIDEPFGPLISFLNEKKYYTSSKCSCGHIADNLALPVITFDHMYDEKNNKVSKLFDFIHNSKAKLEKSCLDLNSMFEADEISKRLIMEYKMIFKIPQNKDTNYPDLNKAIRFFDLYKNIYKTVSNLIYEFEKLEENKN